MSCFNTSFLTLTLVAFLDVLSQCCFASCANSDSPSVTGTATAAVAGGWLLGGCDEALFFCLLAVGMVAGALCGRRRVAVSRTRSWVWQFCCFSQPAHFRRGPAALAGANELAAPGMKYMRILYGEVT